jgi:cytochrome c
MRRTVLALMILTQAIRSAAAAESDLRLVHGEALAREMCAGCHAVGTSDRSPHPTAPAFRSLERRVGDLDEFFDRLRQGLTSSHPGMPTFLFGRDDARNLIAYLRSLQAAQSN